MGQLVDVAYFFHVSRCIFVSKCYYEVVSSVNFISSSAGFQTTITLECNLFLETSTEFSNSLADLSSITISSPQDRDKSTEVKGAAT
ncbi:hypothetical protein L6452_15170 [Arctium lappa]|uniref:Uncharacterized protein n=1 Tax=Arctium lappa TaxID=4217 RepID=A0ACB9CN10_ARCLA|nr:hypothetical protein L6452_15170 [Arctium lappa]